MGCSYSKRSKTTDNAPTAPTPTTYSRPEPEEPKSSDEFIEETICRVDDLSDNSMKSYPIWEEGCKVLLVKQDGEISALGPKCTHYGAPLEKGALGDGRIRCQWHGACFNAKTGDIEDFPGMDSLPCYQVTIQDGNVKVRASKASLKTQKRAPAFRNRDFNNNSTYVVVGGGPCGATCVETLRAEGYTGRIVFVVGEPYLPYDRIKLSKDISVSVEKIQLRSEEFYKERDIEVKLGVQMVDLDADDMSIKLSDGVKIAYEKLFLATGSSARRLPAPGIELGNIFVLRTADDAKQINSVLTAESNVVILGSSFIGLELAAAVVGKALSVTVVAMEAVPFGLALGNDVGLRVKQLFEEKGVKFRLEQKITAYEGEGNVKNIVLEDGSILPADIVVQGVGVVSNTSFLTKSGLEMLPHGPIRVDEHLQSNLKGVYAGGDIAYAPVLEWDAAIGHWGLASYHGRIAALNMAGKPTKLDTIPFFWTVLFGKSLRYCGYAPNYKSFEIRGDLESLTMVVCYILESGKVGAVLTCGRDPVAAAFGERLKQKKDLLVGDIDKWLETL